MAVLKFYGAAQEVTGSCHLLETPALGRILLDCGMHQGGDAVDRIQDERFDFDVGSIRALVLSHAHLDHSGLIPILIHQGFNGPIYCTNATRKLLPVMLKDAAGLYERDLEYENRRRKRRGEKTLKAAYTKRDVEKAISLCHAAGYRQSLDIGEGATLCFHDAGHILGSAITELRFREGEQDKTLVFSGDLGNKDSALMNDPAILGKADLVMMESTYGNRNHRSKDDTLVELEQILSDTWERKGNVMIPAFAVGRTQEILYYLSLLHKENRLQNWTIFLDSPMAIEVTRIYEDCVQQLSEEDVGRFDGAWRNSMRDLLPNLTYTRTPEESMAINKIASGAIIIAGSGMCTGGRIRHHFKQRIWNRRNTIIFAGFQARGTLGRLLVDGVSKVRMFRDDFAVKAQIATLGGFSAHAGQSELIEWLRNFQPKPRTVLVHGEPEALDALALKLQQECDIHPEVPATGDAIRF